MEKHAVPPAPDEASLVSMVETFKALADPTRARIVLALLGGERTVNDMVEVLRAPQSSVSRHLAVLRATGLVATRRDANRVFYRLANRHLGDLVLQAFSHAEHDRLGLPDHPGQDRSGDGLAGEVVSPAELVAAVEAETEARTWGH